MSALLPINLINKLAAARSQNQKVVLATGVFDVLHSEHRAFLQAAKELGDFLVVGIESDVRVKKLKGPDRPINPQAQRVANLQTLAIADAIFILPEQFSQPADHEALIVAIKPAYLAVSAHTAHLEAKTAILAKVGGQVIVVRKHNQSISTTQLLQQQQDAG